MKKSVLRCCIAGILAIFPMGLYAQSYVETQRDSLMKSHRIIFIDEGEKVSADSVSKMFAQFYYDQFRHFQDPDAPYFLFMSKDARLAMGMGGAVKMRGWFDWHGGIPSGNFAPYLIPIPADPTCDRQFATSAAGTALFFKVIGSNNKIGHYQFYIEGKFDGYKNRDFHLKKAYVIVNDWTLGYAKSTFSDPAAEAPTVDTQGPNDDVSDTEVLVRWMHTIKSKWVVALSLESPEEQIMTQDGITEQTSQWTPDAAAFLQYQWGGGQHIRLAGMVRNLTYRDMITNSNRNVVGWGLLLGSVWRPTHALTTYLYVNGGKGYSSMVNDLSLGAFDLVPDADKEGRLYAPAAFGWNVGVQYNFSPNLFTSANFGECRFLPEYSIQPDTYKYGLYGAVNLFWNPIPRVQVGAEFNLGKRQNENGEHRWARRIEAMMQFSF